MLALVPSATVARKITESLCTSQIKINDLVENMLYTIHGSMVIFNLYISSVLNRNQQYSLALG